MREQGTGRTLVLLLALLLLAAHATAQRMPGEIGLGQALGANELARFDITVFPDGRGLPPGQGGVAEGEALFREKCAACHGASGIQGPAARLAGSDGWVAWSDPLRPLRILAHPLLVQSVGGRWPYASSLFDYVRRAMPPQAPRSLSDDEVYALVAYLLRLNGLAAADAVLDRQSLPAVVMPGLARSFNAWDGTMP